MTYARPPQDVFISSLIEASSSAQKVATLALMRLMVTLPMTRDGRVTVLPGISLVVAIGVWIARSHILAICVRVELRAIAGIFDNLLRQCGSYGSRRDKSGGTNQCEFHLGSPGLISLIG